MVVTRRQRARGLTVVRAAVVAVGITLVAAACNGESDGRTAPADAVIFDTTTPTQSSNDPPAVVAGAAGPDGHRAVRLNPSAWEGIATRYVTDDPADPYHELHSEGHDDFWFGVRLHPEMGPGWTGELGLFGTDCAGAGICVRFDPDGGAGPIGPLLSRPDGEVEIEQIERGYRLVFRNLVFDREDRVSYRIDVLVIDTT